MLRTTYAKLGRLTHKALTPFFKLYVTEKHLRVRVLLLNEQKEVLLVKSWLGHQRWTLPGGGIRRRELLADAAAREVYEETGIRIAADHLQELGAYPNADSNATFTVACFFIEIAKREPQIARRRRLEMLDMAWFSMAQLPDQHSSTVDKALELYRGR